MSIINDALKKTEQSIHKLENNGLASDRTEGHGLPSVRQSHSQSPYILYILILVAGLILSNFIFNLLSHKTTAARNNAEPIVKAPAKEIAAEPFPVIPPAPQLEENKVPETAFILNGIFFSDNDGYALVNNQIVRENDLVDGAKVKTITANTIELDNAGKIITLATQR